MHKAFLTIPLLLFSIGVCGQPLRISDDPEQFVSEVTKSLSALDIEAGNKVSYDFRNIWPKLTDQQQETIIGLARQMKGRGMQVYPHFLYYFGYITYSKTEENISSQELSEVLEINREALNDFSYGEYEDFLLSLNFFFARRILYTSRFSYLKATGGSYDFKSLEYGEFDELYQSNYSNDPIVNKYDVNLETKFGFLDVAGPVIEFENLSLELVTRYDSSIIKDVSGFFLLRKLLFIGEQGTFDWSRQVRAGEGAKVGLGKFFLKAKSAELQSAYAKAEYPVYFKGGTQGFFKFISQEPIGGAYKYPQFTSYHADLNFDLPEDNVSFYGGFGIKGNKTYGKNLSNEKGTLTILDGNGRSAVFRSRLFEFQDSTILGPNTSFSLIHNNDSLYHSNVKLRYDRAKHWMGVYNYDGKGKDRPFNSTFFEMEFLADAIEWDLDTDSLNIEIMNASNIIPAIFTSHDYFNNNTYEKHTGLFSYHPVALVVKYADDYNIKKYNLSDLKFAYDFNPKFMEASMKYLNALGFINYNVRTEDIEVLPKAFHQVKSNFKKKDYDHLLISSLSSAYPNATISFDSAVMIIRGVKEFYLSAERGVTVEPDSGIVKLKKGRGLLFDGTVNAGEMVFKGKKFLFDYQGFSLDMKAIDSIRLSYQDTLSTDSSKVDDEAKKETVDNHLTETSGILSIDRPGNKSGIKEYPNYPLFSSNSNSTVYFNQEDILDGAYDRSIRFEVPPFVMDSVDSENPSAAGFEGTFYTNGIFPEFDETLLIMPDKSFGFYHSIPSEGFNLYNGPGKIYGKLKLDKNGIQSEGSLSFLSTKLFSDDFTFYMDSVTAVGSGGNIEDKVLDNASFPQAVLGKFKMRWLPRKDSLYIENIEEPFQFYNGTASLDGKANITTNGMLGSGTLLTRGTIAKSKNLKFTKKSYSARHADFKVLTDIPDKPALAGDDILLDFDLDNNIADIQPEVEGVAAISFPYAQIKTSITKATWDLADQKVYMNKPEDVDIKNSYFYSTRPELDSLAFNATEAVYDFNTTELVINGIPFITVADAKIIPQNNRTIIQENSKLQTLTNAEIILDTLNEYHYLYDAEVEIFSKNDYAGSATYQLTTASMDTFAIRFENFNLQEIEYEGDKKRKKYKLTTVSEANVDENDLLKISSEIFYKGKVKLFAFREALSLDGFVKLNIDNLPDVDWLAYTSDGTDKNVSINVNNSITQNGDSLHIGIHYTFDGRIYTTFTNRKESDLDYDAFSPNGYLSFNDEKQYFIVEEKTSRDEGFFYDNDVMIYDDNSEKIVFEGLFDFFPNLPDFKIDASVIGNASLSDNYYEANSFLILDFPFNKSLASLMTKDLNDIVERIGPPLAYEISENDLQKLSYHVGDEVTKTFELKSIDRYIPLIQTSSALLKPLVLSDIKFIWSPEYRSWYSKGKIGLSNIYQSDINAKFDGFCEIKNTEEGAVFHLFLYAAPGSWYYFNLQENQLSLYSGNPEYNQEVKSKSNIGKAKVGQLVIGVPEENFMMEFINRFRKDYFGIEEPFDIQMPEDVSFQEEEALETIEEEEINDDDFGF
ncbi:MAG TPA: hypothetical protein ACFCUD_04585 [Cyclobacteriaceae bacterium]